MLKLHMLASGSKGNAAIIENAETGAGVLIDCGICKRDFLARCDEAGFDPTGIEAVVVTHEHGDHTKGLGVVLRRLAKLGCAPAIYANDACVENSSELRKIAMHSMFCLFRQHFSNKKLSRSTSSVPPVCMCSPSPPATTPPPHSAFASSRPTATRWDT